MGLLPVGRKFVPEENRMTPEDRKYTRSHEWVKLDGDTAVVGITDYAQEALGDITYVELPETEHTVTAGEECAVIESVKAASDIFAPLAGEVVAVNSELATRPEIVNEDPYGRGWIFKLGGVDVAGFVGLMDASEYDATLEDEE
jgi:glycine cleavage system H protein